MAAAIGTVRSWGSILIGLVAVCGTCPLFAANTGSLSGTVLDGDGAPLPGVTVQISSDSLIGGPRYALSGPNGEFSFQLLLVGTYTAEATLPGFQTATGQVLVRSNHVGSVTFRMVPEQFAGEIEVTAEVPVVDTSQVNSGVVWDDDYLQLATVGSANRDYQAVLSQAPGVTGPSNPSVFGSTLGENSYLIDGMNTSDPTTGTWTTRFSIDAVKEMSFQTGGFEAEFGQATGGIVNLVTRSGGNEFSGSFDVRYRGDNFIEHGDHFDPDELTESNTQLAATLGGPIRRDRLWFFASLQYIDSSSQEEAAHFPSEFEGLQGFGKITWQAGTANRLIFRYTTTPAAIPGINSSRYVLESARETQEQGSGFWHLELNSVPSESWLLAASAGMNPLYLRAFPTDNPDTLSSHWNEDTDLRYNSSSSVWDEARWRLEVRATATRFIDHLAGAHELKGGLEYNEVKEELTQYRTGGGGVTDHSPSALGWEPVDLNGDGYFNHYVSILEPEERAKEPTFSYGEIATAFLQDTWRPIPPLTVKAGLRWDRVVATNHLREETADMYGWQPRLGIAWDVTGKARHVLRATIGRFMDPTSLAIPYFASGVEGLATHEYTTLEYYCNTSRGLWCDEDSLPPSYPDPFRWTNWGGQEYTLIDNRGISWPSSATTVDQEGLGRLRAPHSDQLILAYETEVATDSSIELSYVRKKSADLIEDTCRGNAWAYDPSVPFPSLDDPSTWTTADQCGGWLIVNMPGLERRYDAWIVRAESRKAWGHLMASYTYSDSRGTAYSGPRWYAYEAGDYFPVNFYNYSGQMPDHRAHRLKLNGYLLLPKRFTIGVDAFWSSPGHQTLYSPCSAFRNAGAKRSKADQMAALGIDPATAAFCTTPDGVNLDGYGVHHTPRGSVEMKSVWQVDVQLSKGFRVGGTEVQAILTVFNLLGQEWDRTFNSQAFLQDTDENGTGLFYQDDDPGAPYYDEYYGADSSPVLVPIGAPLSYWDPRRYEIGFRIEF